jgi:hypothetical protein
MGTPITQEDLDLMQTINIKNAIQFYKYLVIVSGIGFTYYLYFQLNQDS